MKKLSLLSLFLFLFIGCKANKTVEFCEGISIKGEGANCGDTFSAGELTAIIKPESPFNINKIIVNIYKKSNYRTEKIDTLSIEVKPEENTARANLFFYDEGEYAIEAIGLENKKIAGGSVKIIDMY